MKALALLLLAGCAGGLGEIVTDTGELPEGSGTPKIDAVDELGGGDVVLTGPIRSAPGDGVVAVGEALWVHGSSFGRQPTVTIGGRPAAVLARTTDGGLVARVPPGASAGAQTLSVTTQQGHGTYALTIRRLVAAVSPEGGRVLLAALGPDGPGTIGAVPVMGQRLCMSADGRAAYVLDAGTGKVSVIELSAPVEPRAGLILDVAGRGGGGAVRAFAAASASPALMILRQRDLVLLDIAAPLHPVRSQPRPLPPPLRADDAVAAAALSPDGRVAAILLGASNRLVLLDLRGSGEVTVAGTLALAPEARVPVVADVSFTPDGRTVWVALGDTVQSRAVGPQITELLAVRLGIASAALQPGGGGGWTTAITRRVQIPDARWPVRLNTGRASPLPSGASIRLPPERAAVYLTASDRAGKVTVFRLGSDDKASAFLDLGGPAGAAELSCDGRWLLVPALEGGHRMVLAAIRADDHPGATVRLQLDAVAVGPAAGSPLPAVACQP